MRVDRENMDATFARLERMPIRALCLRANQYEARAITWVIPALYEQRAAQSPHGQADPAAPVIISFR
ncbi:hypothetical protein GCM10017557_00030 [Streptomyces aurantiacus]|uniref:Uncharacterized protein n=1 Tax=Streptomyces aurantiacus TaxID=47760 RepID=A0A7G1NU31_9ACTN|nr:hypothetical protein GCM10017557_00030 [Streptomyces aurantiacus]